MTEEQFNNLNTKCNEIIGMLVVMMNNSDKWCSFNPNKNNNNER